MKSRNLYKGGHTMGESKQVLSTFIEEERFNLHSYLTYLFINERQDNVVNQLEQEYVNQ